MSGAAQSDPGVTTPRRVALLLRGPVPDDVEALAVDFCDRGPAVRLVPVPAGTAVPVDVDAALTLGPGGPASRLWRLTDVDGAAVAGSPRAVGAVLRGHPWIEVHLRDADGAVRARGRVGTRRSVAATVHRMLRVAGPLLVNALADGPAAADPPEPPAAASRSTPATADRVALVRFAGRLARAAVTCRQWAVARVDGLPDLPPGIGGDRAAANRAAADRGAGDRGSAARRARFRTARASAFWADPCVVAEDGDWLFVEELDRWTGRGLIRLLQVTGDDVAPGPVCRSTAHHLSYPQVYRTSSGWLATVETCARDNPILGFDRVGDVWREAGLGALPPHLGDPVLILDGDEVTGLVATDAATDPDAVAVEYRRVGSGWRRVDDRTWVDVVRARGGGTLDRGRGLRAAQDCAGTYGRAVEVTGWPDAVPVARLDAGWARRHVRGRRWVGLHTLAWAPGDAAVWVDGWRRRITPLGGLWRVVERRHLSRCEG